MTAKTEKRGSDFIDFSGLLQEEASFHYGTAGKNWLLRELETKSERKVHQDQ
jgi:hypothetical protein